MAFYAALGASHLKTLLMVSQMLRRPAPASAATAATLGAPATAGTEDGGTCDAFTVSGVKQL
jgi:hypothetical protein